MSWEAGSLVAAILETQDDGISETFERQVDLKSSARPERSANVIRRLIESRVCNGKRLRMSGLWRRHRAAGWTEVDVVADGTGEAMGQRWFRQLKHGKWEVTATEPIK